MDCNCNKGKFCIGLGLGAFLGAVAYYCARTEKAKELKAKMCCTAHSVAEKAGEWMTNAKEHCACAKDADGEDSK